MKFLIVLLFSISTCFAMEFTFQPQLGVGLRAGGESLNDDAVGYFTFKTSLLTHQFSSSNSLNFLSPSLNYQMDGKWAVGVSPISFVAWTGTTIGLDYIHEEEGVRGGKVGFFIGITLK